ncbi:PAS domain S-box-containing protein [Pararhizobium capsulatum DSM 1112]|uniref:histidine kinase n=1 Tax=Pararhizobium capsulatum DSM 1112 TaxID=1121113 RepID=A0ABU0BMM7_9HYPH|nr:PAS domain-containing sensor histidine kinase [Pararhizobium capsulatum]MDQ0319513.1 PAS domain S-box-containing protein [Pararhizobium capsulatum DSM 1112]
MQTEVTWERLGLWTGCISAFLGAIVAVLWLAQPQALATQTPMLFAMQFNTGLCFVLTGVSLATMQSPHQRWSLVLSTIVIAFAIAALIQHLTAKDLGIDRMIVTPFFQSSVTPGRMAANTALCLILVNISILLTGWLGRNSHIRLAFAGLVFMIAASALIGHLLNATTNHDWLPLARMSPQTAVCFLALSTGLIFSRPEQLGYQRTTMGALLAATTYLLLVLLTYLEFARQEVLFTEELPATENGNARSTLLAILLFSGIIYALLILYALRTAQRQRNVARQLAESQQRLSAIIDTAVDGFITIDDRGMILSVNPACEAIFGYQAAEMLSQNVKMLMPQPYRREHDQYIANYNSTGYAKIIGIGREVQGRRKDGSTFPLDLSVAKVNLGHQTLYSGIVRDISDRKRYEREILEANAELEEFSYRTSHDLRSPIASSIGMISIVQDMISDGASPEDLKPVLARIDTSFRKLDGLIQNIILLTRVRVLEEPETLIPIARSVHDTVERLRYMDTEQKTEIHIDVPPALAIHKKASRFQIIVDNLVSNALKYRDPDEARPKISIIARQEGHTFVLSVADNGLGIQPGDEKHLFQMFRRFHPHHAYGSGLGLYILKKSAEHLGGTVSFHRRQKGSQFIVTEPDGRNP